MKPLLFIILFCLLYCQLSAQPAYKLEKGLAYKAAINNSGPLYLVAVTDSSLVTSPAKTQYGNRPVNATETPYYEIERFKLYRAGSARRGTLFGALAGAAAGALLGLTSGTSHGWSSGTYASLGAILGTLPGALVGAIIGSKERKYATNKNREGFRNATRYLYR